MSQEPKYLLTLSRFNTDHTGISDHYVLKGEDLAVVLSQLPLAVATICKKESDAKRLVRIREDDDIPF